MPFSQLIDWERIVVRIDENLLRSRTAEAARTVLDRLRQAWLRDGGSWPPTERVTAATDSTGASFLRVEYVLPEAVQRKQAEICRVYRKYFSGETQPQLLNGHQAHGYSEEDAATTPRPPGQSGCMYTKVTSLLKSLRRVIADTAKTPSPISRMLLDEHADESKPIPLYDDRR
ncbi:unnamed protein product [Amoebophrya sp. A25]|nr:unnamed protein product [Amoebophrya sp. A25]|eukprot:GSA25T00023585001.1